MIYRITHRQTTVSVRVFDVTADSLSEAKAKVEVGPITQVEDKEGVELVDKDKYEETTVFEGV